MKRFFFAIAVCALLSMVSCQKAGPTDSDRSADLMTITASLENDGAIAVDGEEVIPETKTMRQSNGDVWWTPGDAISLFFGASGEPGGNKFSSDIEEPAAVSSFTGEIGAATGGGEGLNVDDYSFWAVYPYGPTVAFDGKSVTFPLPANQASAEGTFAPGQWPTMAKSAGLLFSFKNVVAGYKFKVQTEGITKVVFSTPSADLPLAGTINAGMSKAGIPVIKSVADKSSTVTVTPVGGGTFKTNTYYYASVIYGNFGSGVTMTFYKDGKMATYQCVITGDKPEHPSGRGKFKVMDNKDAGLTWVDAPLDDLLPGVFSVGPDKKVSFARGNIWSDWSVEPYTWNMELHQYDVPPTEKDPYDNDIAIASHVGLFTWNSFVKKDGVPDWAGPFSEANGYPAGTWRVLSQPEWEYLLSTRGTTLDNLRHPVTVCGLENCLVLGPDGNTTTIAESYSEAEWKVAEAAGFVCLPAAGLSGEVGHSNLAGIGNYGGIWTADQVDATYAYRAFFRPQYYSFTSQAYLTEACSIRLVQDVK